MKANELRIGNYYNQFGNIHQISVTGIAELEKAPESQLWCKPIPITEQWLIDFGFTKPRSIIVEYAKNGFELYFITTDDFYQAEFGNFTIDVKFVHQLQNLYFALVGEELTKKI